MIYSIIDNGYDINLDCEDIQKEVKKPFKANINPIQKTEIQNNFHFHQSPTYNNYFDTAKATYLNTQNGKMTDLSNSQNKNNETERQPKTTKNGMIAKIYLI